MNQTPGDLFVAVQKWATENRFPFRVAQQGGLLVVGGSGEFVAWLSPGCDTLRMRGGVLTLSEAVELGRLVSLVRELTRV